jgi:isoleucyl-tRNA synthetase
MCSVVLERRLTCGTVVNALSNFANVTLSAFYLDIVKDCLYADARANAQRRTVVAVMDQVRSTCVSSSVHPLSVYRYSQR